MSLERFVRRNCSIQRLIFKRHGKNTIGGDGNHGLFGKAEAIKSIYKKMEQSIEKFEDKKTILEKLENLRFYISTPEQAGDALVFSKRLKDFAKLVEEKVKKRGGEIMSEQDLKMIEAGDFVITRINPSRSREYKASSIIEAVGPERANALLKVDNTKVNDYMKRQGMTPEEMTKSQVGMKLKDRKGYIKIVEKK